MTDCYPKRPKYETFDEPDHRAPIIEPYVSDHHDSISTTPIIIDCNERPDLINPLFACKGKDGDLWCCHVCGIECCMCFFAPCMAVPLYRRLKVMGKIKSFFNFYFTGYVTWLIWIFVILSEIEEFYWIEKAYKNCMNDLELRSKIFNTTISTDDISECKNERNFEHSFNGFEILFAFLLITLYKSKTIFDKIRKVKDAGTAKRNYSNCFEAVVFSSCSFLQVRKELNLIEDELRQENELLDGGPATSECIV